MICQLLRSVLVLTLLLGAQIKATAGNPHGHTGKRATHDWQSQVKDDNSPHSTYAELSPAFHLYVIKSPSSPLYAILPGSTLIATKEIAGLCTYSPATFPASRYRRAIIFPFHGFW